MHQKDLLTADLRYQLLVNLSSKGNKISLKSTIHNLKMSQLEYVMLYQN